MKNTNKCKLILGIFIILLILSSKIDLFTYQNEKTFMLKNIEALAEEENLIDEAKKICTEAGGLCFYRGGKFGGIHYKMD